MTNVSYRFVNTRQDTVTILKPSVPFPSKYVGNTIKVMIPGFGWHPICTPHKSSFVTPKTSEKASCDLGTRVEKAIQNSLFKKNIASPSKKQAPSASFTTPKRDGDKKRVLTNLSQERRKKRPCKNPYAKNVHPSTIVPATHNTVVVQNNYNINVNSDALPGTPNLTQDSPSSKNSHDSFDDVLTQDWYHFPAF